MNQVPTKSVRFKEGQLERIRELAQEKDRAFNWVVVRAVEEYLQKNDK